MSARVAVLGAGSWGLALAVLIAENGHDVALWEFDEAVAARLKRTRQNPDFLPGISIPPGIQVTHDLGAAVEDREIILVVVPSHVVRSVSEQLAAFDFSRSLMVSASKGIENTTLLRMSQIFTEVIPTVGPEQVVVLSGPSHAEEVARKIPTLVVAGSSAEASARRVQAVCMNSVFRVYTNMDIVGVELGGALKNVIAIAAGISDGVGFGDNTKAALLNRGIVEITRLGTALGADPMTFAGLSGMGDLIVTCMSRHSRNRHVGEEIGKGKTLQEVLDGMVMVAEGVRTTRSVHDLAIANQIDVPISEQVYEILFNGKDAKKAVYDLMTRIPKSEDWG